MADHAIATITNPSSALTDFTLIVNLANLPQDWWDAVTSSDGTKGRVFKGDGTTELASDWIEFDDVGETGFLRAKWAGTLATSGTQQLWIEPPLSGNSSYAAADTYGSDNAYDAYWEFYWPGHDQYDRTANSRDLTAGGGVTFGSATGPFGDSGGATNFDHVDDEGNNSSVVSLTTFSAFCWFENDVDSDSDSIFAQNNGSDQATFYIRPGGTSGVRYTDIGYIESAIGELDRSLTWSMAALVSNGTNLIIYQDGTAVGTDAAASTSPYGASGGSIAVGHNPPSSSQNFDGDIAHAQIHAAPRAEAWIDHEFAQIDDNATFWGSWTWVAAGGATAPTGALYGSLYGPFAGPIGG